MANTMIYKEDWEVKLQEQLDEQVFWKDICRVDYTDTKVLHNPYQNDATASAYTRGNQYTYNDITVTDETVDINTAYVSPEFIDRADLAQTGYDMQMERAVRQAQALMERIETSVLAEYTNAGNTITNASIGGAAGSIALSSTNVDDVIRAIRREIVKDAGLTQLKRNGGFIVWRPEDFEKVVAFAQANGFRVADDALSSGTVVQMMGFTHYESNLLTVAASVAHCLAGVKGSIHLGILNTTFGEVIVDDKDPDNRSGISIVSRVDYKAKVWNNSANLLCDVQITE